MDITLCIKVALFSKPFFSTRIDMQYGENQKIICRDNDLLSYVPIRVKKIYLEIIFSQWYDG